MFISRSCCSGTVVEFHWKQMSTLLEEHICCLLFKKNMWRIHVRYKWSIWSFNLFTVLQSSFRTVIQWKSDDKHWSWDKHAHIIFKWIFLNKNLYILIQIPPRYIPKGPLTHLPLVLHICVCESDQHRFRQWLVAYSAPSHNLNQCWIIINWTLRNDFQWNFDQNTNFSFKKLHLKMLSAKMAAMLYRGRWVKPSLMLMVGHQIDNKPWLSEPVMIQLRFCMQSMFFLHHSKYSQNIFH